MVAMATGELCPQRGDDAGEAHCESVPREEAATVTAAAALHERLVAYVHALSASHEARCGVWVEHSYARGAAPAARALLAPRPPAPAPRLLDVCARDAPPAPLEPPDSPEPPGSPEPDAPEDEWEARVLAAAPVASHARLATLALDALRRLRLARLAGAARAGSARAAARRLRLALAGAPGAVGWLHASLETHAPARVRRLYAAALAELRRAAPRVAARLGAGEAAPAPLSAVGAARAPGAGPWLAWLGCGRARADARWTRRLGALVHVRVLTAPETRAAPPDAWCATVTNSLRAALDDVFAEAGERCVFVGGCGAGAALSVALGGRARGLVLLAPLDRDAEGEAGGAAWRAVRAPLLAVAPGGAAARALCRAPRRRLLEVRGADAQLRLPRALRARLRLPQHALDAAVAEECARWMAETAEGRDAEEEAPPGSPEERPPPAPPSLAAADILRLPIVFADDAVPPPVTVTSGAARYSRVIVASRGRGSPAASGPAPPAGVPRAAAPGAHPRGSGPGAHPRGSGPGAHPRAAGHGGHPRGPRPVLLRRVLPRTPR